MTSTTDITFILPIALGLLVLVPLLWVFLAWRGLVRRASIQRIGQSDIVETLMQQISPMRRRIKATLWLLTLTSLIIALSRPTWGFELDAATRQSLDVVFIVDVSRSMNAEDVSPSRLERAKITMQSILNTIPDVNASIILFARDAYTYMPMTSNIDVTEIFIRGITTNAITAQGTDLETPLRIAETLLIEAESPNATIIIISDGENFEGNPTEPAQDLADTGYIIHTLGYGTEEGSIIPLYDADGRLTGYRELSNGGLATSRLQPELLQNIAAIGNGFYAHVTGIEGELGEVYQSMLAQYEFSAEESIESRPIERFVFFVILAAILLTLEIVLPETRGA